MLLKLYLSEKLALNYHNVLSLYLSNCQYYWMSFRLSYNKQITCYIQNDYNCIWFFYKRRSILVKPLLPSSVPKLNSNVFTLCINCFVHEINIYSWLRIWMINYKIIARKLVTYKSLNNRGFAYSLIPNKWRLPFHNVFWLH
jgi:hypothetical protein